jgi:ankyrin repeat protein
VSIASAARYSTRQRTFLGRRTALILAAVKGHTLVVEQLIAAGADLNVKSSNR